MAHSNPIWQFFHKVRDSKVKCKDCNKLYSLGSDHPRFQTVTGLRSHLAKCHNDINETLLKRAAENDGFGFGFGASSAGQFRFRPKLKKVVSVGL